MDSIVEAMRTYDIIILVSYFGLVNLDDTINSIRRINDRAVIIVDDVQNWYGFGVHVGYDYCFTSYRKWFPVPDGAQILYQGNVFERNALPPVGEYSKYKAAGNILKNFTDIIDDGICLNLLEQGEKLMDDDYLYGCSKISARLIGGIDVKRFADVRRRNAGVLHDMLESMEYHITIMMSARHYLFRYLRNQETVSRED